MRRIERERTKRGEGFADWLSHRLTERGYDLSTPRAGGKAQFARDTGISHPVITRALRGHIPTPDVLELMAPALGVPLRELLVRAGILTEQLHATSSAENSPPTPRQLAALAGIHDPELVKTFETFVVGLRAQQAQKQAQESTE